MYLRGLGPIGRGTKSHGDYNAPTTQRGHPRCARPRPRARQYEDGLGWHRDFGQDDVAWGGYGAYFAEPDGHLWEIAWNPFWTMDEEGDVSLAG